MSSPMVLIVGAGPTGMTAAIELRRTGFNVRIIEKSDHMARYSQALVLQARTLEQLQRYGLADEAIARGRKLDHAKFTSEGRQIVTFTLDRVPSRYPYALFIPQTETESILNRAMESLGVKTERQVELISLAQEEEIHVTLRHANGTTEEVRPQWLLGCDGAHSAVREKTGTPFEGGGVGLSFVLGDFVLEGPDVPGDELSLHVHRGNVIFLARLPGETVRLIAALHEDQDTDGPLEGQDGSPRPDLTIEDFQKIVDEVGVRVKIRSAEWMTPFRVNDRQAKHYRIGKIFLAGDASHIHSPVGGQGMNTGMQDAANLAWKLAAVDRGANDSLLDSYEQERQEVGRALLQFTERGLKMATISNPLLIKLRDTIAPILATLHPLQQRAVGFISETAIHYRSSAIVADHGGDGDLRAGDRLPDLSVSKGKIGQPLLANWVMPRHQIFALNASNDYASDLMSSLRHIDVIPLQSSNLDKEGQRLLGNEGKVIILRPDGYVGFRGPLSKRRGLQEYARQDALV